MTEEINHLLHCARIETFELNEDKIVSNHISSDNANLLVDGRNQPPLAQAVLKTAYSVNKSNTRQVHEKFSH